MITTFFVIHLGFVCDLCVVTKMRQAFYRPAAHISVKDSRLHNLWKFKEKFNAILRVTDITATVVLL